MHVSYNGRVTDKTIGSHPYMQVKVPASCSWNPDWDGRMRDGIYPQSERRIYLIRHGHYKPNSEDKGLTDIGYQKARVVSHSFGRVPSFTAAHLELNPDQG